MGQREDARVEPVSPTLAIPLFEAAQDESRTELQELWARLLANAMDGSRSGVRTSFIEAIKKLDALDAVVLDKIASFGGAQTVVYHDSWPEQLGVREDELFVSFDNLKRLGCISDYNNVALHNTITGDELRLYVTHFGRELMRACAL
nr:Abi-alpha family protein [Azospirillum soli]